MSFGFFTKYLEIHAWIPKIQVVQDAVKLVMDFEER